MSAPIQSAPTPRSIPTPKIRSESRLPPPADRQERGSPRHNCPTTAKRSDVERNRWKWLTEAGGTPLAEDSLFFARLLTPPLSDAPTNSGPGEGRSLGMPQTAEGIPTQLIDTLTQQLPAQPGHDFKVTLVMPNLGKVHVKANKLDRHWEIQLSFARLDVLELVQSSQDACEKALTQALGHDVQLSLHDDFYS